MIIQFSVPNHVLEKLLDDGRLADMSPSVYAKYVTLLALQVSDPGEVAEFRKAYDRRASTEKQVSTFEEKLRHVKPFGAV